VAEGVRIPLTSAKALVDKKPKTKRETIRLHLKLRRIKLLLRFTVNRLMDLR
jgi:hypothetical protein